MKKNGKIVSLLLALLMVVCMLFSVAFISCNAHHDCSGEACPICEHLHMAVNALQRIVPVEVAVYATIFMCVLAQGCMALVSNDIAGNSPIKLKVKMLN
ncbi:MAG: hypothetical protein PUF65_08075 [Lachnospiraceae bacterium]|nr:hypothetical protein [Lachnospiraceae bacterium]